MLKLIRNFMSHRYFLPYARLTYGVFLCHSIFIQYQVFNLENGIWAQVFETNLNFIAFLTFSFGFSFLTYILVEAPMANVLNDFWRSKVNRDGSRGKSKQKMEKIAKKQEKKSLKKNLNIQSDSSIDTETDKIEDLDTSLLEDDKPENLIQKSPDNAEDIME